MLVAMSLAELASAFPLQVPRITVGGLAVAGGGRMLH
jgi:hypothetical protein